MTESHPTPPPLRPDYASAPPHLQTGGGSTAQTVIRFFIGLIGGTIVSAIIWVGGWDIVVHGSGNIIWIIPTVKLASGITLICIRGWRSLGAGIIVSIALGLLIFFGACAVMSRFG